jgi:hypothetical protein
MKTTDAADHACRLIPDIDFVLSVWLEVCGGNEVAYEDAALPTFLKRLGFAADRRILAFMLRPLVKANRYSHYSVLLLGSPGIIKYYSH